MTARILTLSLIIGVLGLIFSFSDNKQKISGVNSDQPGAIVFEHTNLPEKIVVKNSTMMCRKKSIALSLNSSQNVKVLEIRKYVALKSSLSDLTPLINSARLGNETAAIAMFALIQSCSREGKLLDLMEFEPHFNNVAGCAQIPKSSLSLPLEVLEPAAEAGGHYAQLLYLRNAATVAKFGSSSSSVNSRFIEYRAKAKRFGELAASSGLSDAYALMAYSYLSGEFGDVDHARAYAYTLMLAESGDAEAKSRLSYLYPKLRRDELARVKDFTNVCQQDEEHTTFINPFH